MVGLTPPTVSVSHLACGVNWWFDGDDATINRSALLRLWEGRMQRPLPDSKSLRNQLAKWAGDFGRAPWISGSYHPSVAVLLTKPAMTSAEVDGWNSVTTICERYIEPYARYTAGWTDSLDELRPSGLPNSIATCVREQARKAPVEVHQSMTPASVDDGVLASEWTADEFVVDQTPRHEKDRHTALRTYVHGLRNLVGGLYTAAREMSAETRRDVTEHYDLLLDELEKPLEEEPTAEQLAGYEAQATEFLRAVLEQYPLSRLYDSYIGEAFIRVRKTYTNRLQDGRRLEGTESYLLKRAKAIRTEELRSRSRDSSVEFIVSDDKNSHLAHDAVDDPFTGRTAERYVADDLVTRALECIDADPTLRDPHGKPFWEADIARRLLRGEFDEHDVSEHVALLALIEGRSRVEQPTHSRNTSDRAAAMDVALLARAAIARARRSKGRP